MADTLNEIAEMTRQLLAEAPKSRKGTMRLSPEAAEWIRSSGAADPSPSAPAPSTAADAVGPAGADVDTLDRLAQEVAGCTKCDLSKTRTKTVFADGNPSAGLVFVGEAPGADEDRQGVPFVGRAGKLLTSIIEKGMKMDRSEVYICNVLKCRPPGNRDPQAAERAACMPYLDGQLAVIKPKVICCLGRQAANAILDNNETTGALRGSWHFYEGIPVRVTYHPSYLLRCEDDPKRLATEKRKVWTDIQEVMKVLNGEVTVAPEGTSGDLFS
jgi:DNA polymerase